MFTRVIADGTRRFDMIDPGYHGPLYAEISPKTFPVLLREGSRLSQIRFRQGEAALDGAALARLHAQERLVNSDEADLSNGLALSVDLSGKGSNGFSATAPSATPPSSISTAARVMRSTSSGSRSRRARTRA